MQITRQEFKDAIEAGIAAARWEVDSPGSPQVKNLRAVGEKARHCVRGRYYSDVFNCGCPLKQAGITDREGTIFPGFQKTVHAYQTHDFWKGFDTYTGRLSNYVEYLEIVD